MTGLLGGAAAVAGIGSFIMQGVEIIRQRNAPNSPEPPVALPPINPPEDRNIIGRKDDLKRLASLLHMGKGAIITSKGAVLQGEGGYGKTTLASAYANQTRARYQGGCWINAETREGRAQMFADIVGFGASAFGFAIPNPITEADVKAVTNGIGASGAKLLLVYDNVDDLGAVRPFMPTGDAVDILITTRDTGPVQGFNTFELDVLAHDGPDSPSVDLLLQEAGNRMSTDRADAADVAHTLGGVPLALVIAGALVRRGETFADLNRDITRLLDHTPAKGEQYRDSLSAALALSYDKLSKEAKGVADTLAWWAAEDVLPRLFTDAPGGDWWKLFKSEVPGAWHGFLTDPANLRAAFADLRDLSLLRADAPDAPHRMHRLTATILRHRQAASAQSYARAAAALLMAVYPGGQRTPQDPANWPDCARLTPHALALWAKAAPLWRDPWAKPGWQAMDTLLSLCGVYLPSQGNQGEGVAAKRDCLELTEARLGDTARDIPLVLGNLAVDLYQMGEFAEADERLTRAIALDEEHRPDSVGMAARYMQRAGLESRRKEAGEVADLEQAEEWIEKARMIREDHFGPESEPVALCWNGLGYLRRLQGQKTESADFAQRALTIIRALPNVNVFTLAGSAMNVGAEWLEAGQPAKAEPLLREAHDTFARIHPANPQHADRQKAGQWLIACLYTIARAGDDPEARRQEAATLCADYEFDPAFLEQDARKFSTTPPADG